MQGRQGPLLRHVSSSLHCAETVNSPKGGLRQPSLAHQPKTLWH